MKSTFTAIVFALCLATSAGAQVTPRIQTLADAWQTYADAKQAYANSWQALADAAQDYAEAVR